MAADKQWNLTTPRTAAAFSTSYPRLGQSDEDGKTESSEDDLPQLSDMTKRFAPNPYRYNTYSALALARELKASE